jgi:hypothetical protein
MTYKKKREAKEYQKKLDEFNANEAANEKGIWEQIKEFLLWIVAIGIGYGGVELLYWLDNFDNLFIDIIQIILSIFLLAWAFLLMSSLPKKEDSNNYSHPRKRKAIKPEIKNQVWNRDGGRCVRCGTNQKLEFDHIIPHSKGGADTYRNLQLLCESCNRSKGASI